MLHLIYTTTHLFKRGTHLHPVVEINPGPKSKIGPTWSNFIDCTWSNDWHWTRSNVPHGTGILLANSQPGRASFKILTSFEKTPLILHGRRPRIQKMKCLAQKLTKWRRIEKLWRKREIDIFRILKDLVRFALCKFPTHRRQSGSHFAQGGSILPKLVSMAS